MSLTNSALLRDIEAIANNTVPDYVFKYEMWLHNGNNESFKPIRLSTYNIERDYDGKITDEISCTFLFLPGTWADYIFPYLDDLEISFIKTPLTPQTVESMEKYGVRQHARYKVIVKNPQDLRKNNPNLQDVTTNNVDMRDIITIECQLIPKLIVKLKPAQVGTNCTDTDVQTALTCLLSEEPKRIEGLEDIDMLKGVDMVDADNKEEYENMPIPHNVFLVNLPVWMQESGYGVYTAGLSHYIQDNVWYVYPRLKVERTDSQIRYVNVFLVQNDIYTSIRNTWRREGEDVHLIGALKSQSDDNTSANIMNNGNGVRVPNPNVDNSDEKVEREGNKGKVKRTNNVSEFKIAESTTGADNAPLKIGGDANLYEQVAKINGMDGVLYSVFWLNSAPELIKPGMVCKIHYLTENNEPKMIEGLILKAHHYMNSPGEGIVNNPHKLSTALFVFSKQTLDGKNV